MNRQIVHNANTLPVSVPESDPTILSYYSEKGICLMINESASKWEQGVVVTIDKGYGDGPSTMYAAHVFDNPDGRFDGDGFVLYTTQYWYNAQPGAAAPWLRSSWLLDVKVEPDGDGFKFDGPTGRGTIRAVDYDTLEATRVAVSMIDFAEDIKAAGTSLTEEWARINREELKPTQ